MKEASSVANAWVEEQVQTGYGLQVKAKSLSAEVDQNFYLIATNEDQYIIKISSSADKGHLLFQHALADHLEKKDVQMPKSVENLKGEKITKLKHRGKEFWASLFTWIPGRVLAKCNPKEGKKICYTVWENFAVSLPVHLVILIIRRLIANTSGIHHKHRGSKIISHCLRIKINVQ